MSDVDYWKARCRRAESLLAKARQGLSQTRARARVVQTLGELLPGQWMPSGVLRRKTGVEYQMLRQLERIGIVASRLRGDGTPEREWQLEHLVVVPPEGRTPCR